MLLITPQIKEREWLIRWIMQGSWNFWQRRLHSECWAWRGRGRGRGRGLTLSALAMTAGPPRTMECSTNHFLFSSRIWKQDTKSFHFWVVGKQSKIAAKTGALHMGRRHLFKDVIVGAMALTSFTKTWPLIMPSLKDDADKWTTKRSGSRWYSTTSLNVVPNLVF